MSKHTLKPFRKTCHSSRCLLVQANHCLSKYFPPTKDDLPESKTSRDASSEEEKGQTTSESLAASLPDAPTTEPKSPEEPTAKKQKVVTSSEEERKHQSENEDGFEGPTDDQPYDEKPAATPSQNIDEGWEEVGKDEDAAKSDHTPTPVDAEPVQVEGTKEKMAKVLEADGEVASQASGVPNMLTKDW